MRKRSCRIVATMLVCILLLAALPITGLAASKQDSFVSIAKDYAKREAHWSEIISKYNDWCAYFVLKCADKAGLVKSKDFPSASTSVKVIGNTVNTPIVRGLAGWFTQNNKGTYYYFEKTRGVIENKRTIKVKRDSFVPQPGDLVVYYWNGETDNILCHVGIVTGYNKSTKTVTTAEGNSGDDRTRVQKHVMSPSKDSGRYGQIAGYVRPDCFATVDPTVAFTGLSFPEQISQGKDVQIEGTIEEQAGKHKIVSVEAIVKNGDGTKKLSATAKPNSTVFKLKDSTLNRDLAFNTLPKGNYTLTMNVKTENSKVSGTKKLSFSVIDPSTVKIEFVSVAGPGTLQQGQGNHITGTIKVTNSKIASIKADVKNKSNKVALTKTVKPQTASYKLKDSDLDYALTFGELPAGDYTIIYTVTTQAGTKATKNVSFKVNGSSAYTAIVTPSAGLNLRSGPGTNYSVVAAVPKGTKLKVLSVSKGWAKIEYQGKTVYAANEYLKKA